MESEGLVGMKPPPPLPVATLEDFRMDRADYLKTLPPTETINADYRIVGDLDIAPRGVFDDGEWTYFDFRKAPTSDRTPVVMKVVDGYDSLVNTRWENGFLVAETTSSEGWTLKNGHKYVCVKKRL